MLPSIVLVPIFSTSTNLMVIVTIAITIIATKIHVMILISTITIFDIRGSRTTGTNTRTSARTSTRFRVV